MMRLQRIKFFSQHHRKEHRTRRKMKFVVILFLLLVLVVTLVSPLSVRPICRDCVRPRYRVEESHVTKDPEDWRVYGNVGSDGRDQGTKWNAGFEWTSKEDEEEPLPIDQDKRFYKVFHTFEKKKKSVDPEDWRVYGNVGSDGRDQGTKWNAGFEWTSKEDEEEIIDPEDWRVYGNVGSNGRGQGTNWNAGFEWRSNEDEEEIIDPEDWKVHGNVGSGERGRVDWNAGASYSNGPWSAGASVSNGGNWNANLGYTNGGFSAGAQVGRGGNFGIGAQYKIRF
jgi:hypothetical protein